MSDIELIRHDIAFWAYMVMAQVAILNGNRVVAGVWLTAAAFMILRARRARRIAQGLPSFWQKVWARR